MLIGYMRTIRNYLRTPKGRHDFFDHMKAIAMILAVSAVIMLLLMQTN